MLPAKTVGEPYMGKPYVRFDEGEQETGSVRAPRLLPTLPEPPALRTAHFAYSPCVPNPLLSFQEARQPRLQIVFCEAFKKTIDVHR